MSLCVVPGDDFPPTDSTDIWIIPNFLLIHIFWWFLGIKSLPHRICGYAFSLTWFFMWLYGFSTGVSWSLIPLPCGMQYHRSFQVWILICLFKCFLFATQSTGIVPSMTLYAPIYVVTEDETVDTQSTVILTLHSITLHLSLQMVAAFESTATHRTPVCYLLCMTFHVACVF